MDFYFFAIYERSGVLAFSEKKLDQALSKSWYCQNAWILKAPGPATAPLYKFSFCGKYGTCCFHICILIFTGEGGPAGYWGDSVSGVTAAAAHHPHMANHKDWAWF